MRETGFSHWGRGMWACAFRVASFAAKKTVSSLPMLYVVSYTIVDIQNCIRLIVIVQ